jgi:hypothetical protein
LDQRVASVGVPRPVHRSVRQHHFLCPQCLNNPALLPCIPGERGADLYANQCTDQVLRKFRLRRPSTLYQNLAS